MRGGDAMAIDSDPAAAIKPGTVWVLRDGKPVAVPVRTGLSDGASVEIRSESLKPGDLVLVGLEMTTQNRGLQPPPGMGGPQFGPPRGGRGGGGR